MRARRPKEAEERDKESRGTRARERERDRALVPQIVRLAIDATVSNEARARFVEIRLTFAAAQAVGVPLEIRQHAKNVLIANGSTTAGARSRCRCRRCCWGSNGGRCLLHDAP